jgi:hypothetical protein
MFEMRQKPPGRNKSRHAMPCIRGMISGGQEALERGAALDMRRLYGF